MKDHRSAFEQLPHHLQQICLKSGYDPIIGECNSMFEATDEYVANLNNYRPGSYLLERSRRRMRNTSVAFAALKLTQNKS